MNHGKHVPMCDHRGALINEPVVLKLAADCFWPLTADNNVLTWVRTIICERGFLPRSPSPMARRWLPSAPTGEELVAATFGEAVASFRCGPSPAGSRAATRS